MAGVLIALIETLKWSYKLKRNDMKHVELKRKNKQKYLFIEIGSVEMEMSSIWS